MGVMSNHATPPPPAGVTPEMLQSGSDVVILGPSRKRPWAYAAVVIGLLAMVAGAVFFARSLGKAEGGADTADAAVRRLFDALSNEDLLGMLEALPPSERDPLRSSLPQLTSELGRLGILRSDLNLSDIAGVELAFSGLRLASTAIGPGVTSVAVTAGRSTYRVDPQRSPLGDFVRQLLPPDMAKVVEGEDDLADDEITLTAVRENDRWFVSLWYTVAEDARGDAPPPNFGNGLIARGASSPEQAVEELLRSASVLDVRRLIELMPPDEARALHDYAPLFLPQAEEAISEARGMFNAQIRELEVSSRRSGQTAAVKVDKISFRAEVPSLGISADFDGECMTTTGEFFGTDEPQRLCGDEVQLPPGLPRLPTPDIGIIAVARDGAWYVSPTRTTLEGVISLLKSLDRDMLEAFKEMVASFAGFGAPKRA